MKHYAHVNTAGIAYAVTQSRDEITASNVIELDSFDTSITGKRWTGSGWEDVAKEPVSQFEKDQSRYRRRAAVKDELMAYMAADNMGRVRAGTWSVADLTALLDDPAVVAANALMGTLSFELAAQQIMTATTPLLTQFIKDDWVARLQAHYYLEG